MIVRTKYKRWQFVLEWVTLGLAIVWIAAAAILVNFYCDRENEILKQNLLLLSIIFQVLAYLGFTHISFLPHGNALIKNEKYDKGSRQYQYQKEARLRSAALIAKIVCTAAAVFMGLIKYIL
ncbi:MAG: hypothetical protein NC203_04045 [Firmicutes bacterium]|nr:hypothetical protein [[Eubacterium] siraeum]MCM1487520.1 hypothetical protein [Bacillota bacterium]